MKAGSLNNTLRLRQNVLNYKDKLNSLFLDNTNGWNNSTCD